MENEKLIHLIQQGQNVTENTGLLWKQCEGFIRNIVSKYKQFAEIDDLMQESYFALLHTVRVFDCDRTGSFLGLLKLYVQNRCLRFCQKNYGQFAFHDMGNTIRLYSQLENRLNRTPDKETVMQELNLSEGQYNSLMLAVNLHQSTVNIDTTITDESGEEATLAEKVSSDEDILEDLIQKELAERTKAVLWEQVQQLDIRKSNIIYLIYKLNLKECDIAKNLGIDEVTVSDHKRKALKQLKAMRKIQELAEMYDFDCGLAYKGGLASFKQTNESVVERIVFKRMELEESFRDKQENLIDSIKKGYEADET